MAKVHSETVYVCVAIVWLLAASRLLSSACSVWHVSATLQTSSPLGPALTVPGSLLALGAGHLSAAMEIAVEVSAWLTLGVFASHQQ